jgi:hypothetical protein
MVDSTQRRAVELATSKEIRQHIDEVIRKKALSSSLGSPTSPTSRTFLTETKRLAAEKGTGSGMCAIPFHNTPSSTLRSPPLCPFYASIDSFVSFLDCPLQTIGSQICAACNRAGDGYLQCGQCRSVWYCSKECQTKGIGICSYMSLLSF